jgi:hypothetical protein
MKNNKKLINNKNNQMMICKKRNRIGLGAITKTKIMKIINKKKKNKRSNIQLIK